MLFNSVNMKTLPLTLFVLFFGTYLAQGQCTPELLNPVNFTVTEVDSEDPNHPGSHAIDGSHATFWRTNGASPFPHQIILDLGAVHAVTQVNVLPRQDNSNGKLGDFEIYLSMDGNSWGSVQAKGSIPYTSHDDLDIKSIRFGAIDARYLRLVGLSNYDPSNDITRLLIAELEVYKDPCGATGQSNQHIIFSPLGKKLTTDPEFQLWATSSSGLPVSYEIVSGDATINGNMLTPGSTEGPVVVRAFQDGDGTYYPTEAFQVLQLIDPELYTPTLVSRVSDAFPIEMNDLIGYPLYASASIEHDDLLSITGIDFIINGVPFPALTDGNAYVFWWQPPYFGAYDLQIVATASNGKTTEKTLKIEVAKPTDNQSILTLDNVLIDFNNAARSYIGTYQLPQFAGTYDIITADFWVECPNVDGGCDDWDRLAYVQIKAPDGRWVEFVRYITPYGIGCFHSLELTDYASLLQGEAEIRIFIDTWGTGGWNVNLQLTYERGIPQYLYSNIDVLWEGNFPLGNYANLQPLDTLDYSFPEHTEEAKMLLVTTGHGWGENNSLNAAEFFDARHHIKVDDNPEFEQHLWTNCVPNPDACNGQLGNWESNRAGWCPGIIAPNYEYDFTPFLSNSSMELSYIFQENYVDLCHASHPDCVSGVTCNNCNDGFNPNYQIRGHMITYSNTSLATSTPGSGAKAIPVSPFPQSFHRSI